MKKDNTPASIPEADSSRITFVKSLCSRIQEALDDIEDVFEKVTNPIPDTSCFGKSEGIGLFLYVRDKEAALKEQYPEFTDNEIVSILLTQWEKLDDTEKEEYCSKVNEKKSKKTKKQKKLEKLYEKLDESVSSTEQGGSLDKGEDLSQSLSLGPKTNSKYFAIEEEEEEDSIPRKKMITESGVFAEDSGTVEQKEAEEDNEAKIITPSFQKLEFDVIHEKSEQNEKEMANDNENLMEIEECYDQKVSEASPNLNEEVELNTIQKDNQEIPLEATFTQKQENPDEYQEPPTAENKPEIVPPRESPPSDDVVEGVSNKIESTRECDTCLGIEKIAVEAAVEENRKLIDEPVLIECPSESISLPLPEISRDSQPEEEKPSLPKIEHHQKGEMSENEEEVIVTKFEVPELSEIDNTKPKIESKEHNENPFFDEKNEDVEGIHESGSKESNGKSLEIPELFNFKNFEEECKIQKELGTNINEDEKLIKMEVKQDNTCTEQQEQFEFE